MSGSIQAFIVLNVIHFSVHNAAKYRSPAAAIRVTDAKGHEVSVKHKAVIMHITVSRLFLRVKPLFCALVDVWVLTILLKFPAVDQTAMSVGSICT
jgi:hypothetical protein